MHTFSPNMCMRTIRQFWMVSRAAENAFARQMRPSGAIIMLSQIWTWWLKKQLNCFYFSFLDNSDSYALPLSPKGTAEHPTRFARKKIEKKFFWLFSVFFVLVSAIPLSFTTNCEVLRQLTMKFTSSNFPSGYIWPKIL